MVVPAGNRHFGQPPGGSRGVRTQSVTPTHRISLASPDSLVHSFRAGFRQKGLDNMKQISTGAGLVALSVGMVATAFIATQRGGSEAFAQGTGGERRIVASSVYAVGTSNGTAGYAEHFAYRIWSDNTIDLRQLGGSQSWDHPAYGRIAYWSAAGNGPYTSDRWNATWHTVDNGTSGFRPLTDVDMSGETDAGDISQVLMDMNTRSDDLPPPPIDCTINAPR